MIFLAEGKIMLGNEERSFKKSVEAKTENEARRKVLSLFGSLNGVKATAVKIEKVSKTEG